MDTVTLAQSMIRGSVAGKMIHCTARISPAGLKLPAGPYFLRPAANNPVYGLLMSIEPMWPGGQGPSSMKVGAETGIKMAPAGIKMAPAGLKMAPAGIKMAPADIKMAPAGIKMAPTYKVDSPGAPSAVASMGLPPSAFHKSPPAMREGAIVVSDRFIAGNCLVVTSGFADLVDAVQRAGGVTLIVT